MTADKADESPDVDVSDWTLFADRHHGRIMIFAKHGGRWYDVTKSSDESPTPTPPSELDSDAPATAEISLQVWRDHLGQIVVAEANIQNYADDRHEQSRLFDSAASQLFEVLFDGDTFLTGPATLWGDMPGESGGFLTYTTGAPRTRAQRSAAAKKGLAEAADRARRNATRRDRSRAR